MAPPATAHTVDRLRRLAATAGDYAEFQAESLSAIECVVPFDVAIHTSVDPGSLLDTTCVPFGAPHDPAREMRHFELEYRTDAPLAYRSIARSPARAAALRLEVDDPRTVPRYVEIIEPNGGHDEMRATFVADDQCWGSLTLYRMNGRPDFSTDEVIFFTKISEVMARGLRMCFLRAAASQPTHIADPPGHMTIERSGHILSTTSEAEHWMETLSPNGKVPAVLASLVGAMDHQASARATVIGTAGPVAVHASLAKGMDDAVAVILERPRPIDLSPLLAEAHKLTPRENQVAAAVMQGLTTRQIAVRLGIAEYTVQDHLKSVFAKVGVATRGELTFELFIRHYLPPTRSNATPGPYGYYLDPPSEPGEPLS